MRRLERSLEAGVPQAEPAAGISAPPVPVTGGATFEQLWEHQGEPPPLREHGNIAVRGEPKLDIGQAETWTNRLLGPPYGYGWHGSERAGWTAGKRGAILMDLGEPGGRS